MAISNFSILNNYNRYIVYISIVFTLTFQYLYSNFYLFEFMSGAFYFNYSEVEH